MLEEATVVPEADFAGGQTCHDTNDPVLTTSAGLLETLLGESADGDIVNTKKVSNCETGGVKNGSFCFIETTEQNHRLTDSLRVISTTLHEDWPDARSSFTCTTSQLIARVKAKPFTIKEWVSGTGRRPRTGATRMEG